LKNIAPKKKQNFVANQQTNKKRERLTLMKEIEHWKDRQTHKKIIIIKKINM
jgi:invasion protein IalB